MDTQTAYQQALLFAAHKHSSIDQKVPGTDLPYVVHVCNVAMEILCVPDANDFDKTYAAQIALLHDTLEDTSTTFEELENVFGIEIANGVLALTKNEALPKESKMQDSLDRVKMMRKEVWAVKMADRITNLQKPPAYWTEEKKAEYREEAAVILRELEEGNGFLAERLKRKITGYGDW